MFKKVSKLALVTVLALGGMSVVKPIETQAKGIEKAPTAWPGRPGGDGTGSEEWMNGLKYGQTNGPYKLMYQTSKMSIYQYNKMMRNGTDALKSGLSYYFDGLSAVAGATSGIAGLGFYAIGKFVDHLIQYKDLSYPTSYSISFATYGSGRRLKTVMTIYDQNGNYHTSKTTYFSY